MTDNSKWDEDTIIERYHQLSLARDGGVAVGVDEAIDAATEIYNALQAQLATAQEEIERGRARYEAAIEDGLAAHAGTWQPLADGEVAWGNLAVIDNGTAFDFAGGYDEDTDTFAWHDLVELPPDIRLCQLQPGAYQPIPDGPIGPGATLENRVIWIKCTVGDGIGVKHGYALQDGEVLMRLQPGNPLGKGDGVAPDWSAAPEWAMWWAVDPNGYACWYQEEPVLSLTISYCGWFAKTILGVQQGNALWSQELDLALGIDWRTLKQRRQIAPG